ncbi:MAG: 5-(carboxyamino)imidazole ribonucleotide synthase [Cellvibrionaceae bacterium]|nr:5-(carboxyamino)imidazole ribonucleotide synthase [Cellvibrionaceae bacterium]
MRIAIFGCGQLAQMTAHAGSILGLEFVFIAEPGEDTRCIAGLGDHVLLEPGMTATALFAALGQPQVITVEKEMVDTALLKALQPLCQVYPPSDAIYISQNRIREKQFVQAQGIATADFRVIHSTAELTAAADAFGFPLYVKAAESGYDGYHQWRLQRPQDLEQSTLQETLSAGVSLIAEKHVDYVREISVIAARNGDGTIVYYPLMENQHENGILLSTMAPAPRQAPELQTTAFAMMHTLLQAMDYVGVLTVECFETKRGLLVNELAPRVHNSGHWTIEGCASSQFENHCRAITNKPLGATDMHGAAGLVNLLGIQGEPRYFDDEGLYYHNYGKQRRPGRKLGHITVCSETPQGLRAVLNLIIQRLYQSH